MKYIAKLVPAVLLSLATWNVTAIAQSGHSPKVMQQIMRGLRIQQNAVKCISIRAKTKFWDLDKDGAAFSNSGETQVAAIFGRGGEFYASIRGIYGGYQALAQRKSPFLIMVYSVAYDGRVGTRYNAKAGELGRVKSDGRGSISGRPPRLGSDAIYCAGQTISIWGLPQIFDWDAPSVSPAYKHMTLLDFLEHLPSKAKISAKFRRTHQGRRVVALTIIWQAKDVVELDPARNFSVLQDKQYFMNPVARGGPITWPAAPRNIYHVFGFWEPINGVYYPKHVAFSLIDRQLSKTKPVEKNLVEINRVSMNDPKINAGSYVVHFPRGAVVTDESTGRVIHIGGTPKQQMKQIEKAVAAARKEVATQPAMKGSNK